MEVLLTKDYVYSLLEDKRISKADFARQIGIQRTNLDALLKADKKDINIVLKMAEALGMSLQEFIGFDPSPFRIKGFIKVGEELREIRSEEDWYKAEQDSGICSVPYYSSFDDACATVEAFVKKAIKPEDNLSFMGRVNGEAVFCVSVTNEYGDTDEGITDIIGRQIVVSIMSSRKGMTTNTYSTYENEGDFDFMFTEIKGEIQDIFNNSNE